MSDKTLNNAPLKKSLHMYSHGQKSETATVVKSSITASRFLAITVKADHSL